MTNDLHRAADGVLRAIGTLEAYRAILQQADVLLTVQDEQRFIGSNALTDRFLGHRVIGRSAEWFTSFVHPDDVEQTREFVTQGALARANTEVRFSNRMRSKSGEYWRVSWVALVSRSGIRWALGMVDGYPDHGPIPDDLAAAIRPAGSVYPTDIEDSARAVLRAIEELECFRRILHAADAFLIVNDMTHFTDANVYTQIAIGDRIVGREVSWWMSEIVHLEDRESTIQYFTEAMSKGVPSIRFRNRIRLANGQYVTVAWAAEVDLPGDTGIGVGVGYARIDSKIRVYALPSPSKWASGSNGRVERPSTRGRQDNHRGESDAVADPGPSVRLGGSEGRASSERGVRKEGQSGAIENDGLPTQDSRRVALDDLGGRRDRDRGGWWSRLPGEPAAAVRGTIPAEVPHMAQTTLVQITPAEADELLEKIKNAGLSGVRGILTAFDDGTITAAERDALIESSVDDISDVAFRFLDIVTAFPEPLEALSDVALQQGLESAEPLIADLIVDAAGPINDLLTTDSSEYRAKILRRQAKVAEARNDRQRERRTRRLQATMRRYLAKYPEQAHDFGIRLDATEGPILHRRDQ